MRPAVVRGRTSHTEIEEKYPFFSNFATADFDDKQNSLSNVFTGISYSLPLHSGSPEDPEDLYKTVGRTLLTR